VDFSDPASIAEALKGVSTLYWASVGHSVKMTNAVTEGAKMAGVGHVSVVTSSVWGSTRSDTVKRVETALRKADVPRLSMFRPKILLLPEGRPSARGRELRLEALGGLNRMISEGLDSDELHWMESNWFTVAFKKGLHPFQRSFAAISQLLAFVGVLPPGWHPAPAESVARTMWIQSCWKPVNKVEVPNPNPNPN